MPRLPRQKRKNLNKFQLDKCDVIFLVTGIDMFGEIDYSTIKKKWEIHRGVLMALWNLHEPFKMYGFSIDKNKPGSLPWAYKEFEKAEKK